MFDSRTIPTTLWPNAQMPSPSAPSQEPLPPTSAVEAVRSLARVARLLERASGGLGLAHYRVLSAVAAGEDRASRVAERFELGRPTISAAVDALCREGMLERAQVATDQRAFALALTQKGRDALERAETEMVRALDDLCGRLASSGSVRDALATLGAALDARAGQRHPHRAGGRSVAPGSDPSSS
jgi:DNA-binding MarR family transcriptional regulator